MKELLAPAGSLECAVTAFEAGADAVYAGLSRFNARERNRNFSDDEMSRLSRYAKDHGKKFYVTMNTLIKDGEISDLVDVLERLSRLEPDALILQDLGVFKICRDFFPEFRLHASTQMGIHNRAGLQVAAHLGFSRVILERQLPLEEVAALAANRPTELEVFIHGALCCSLSGMCHFSSLQGGFSGNRGQCKQPCRRLYRNEKGAQSPFFSPDDLQAVPLIHKLKQLGIDSYKIEGRLKRSDYVRQTVSAYRLLLDGDASNSRLQQEAARLLQGGALRRSGIGFYSDDSRVNLLGNRSVQAGEAVAETVAVVGKRWRAKALTEIRLGDKLRLPESAGSRIVTLTALECDGRRVTTVAAKRLFAFEVNGEPGSKPMFSIAPKTALCRVGSQIGKSEEFLQRLKRFDERRPLSLTVRLSAEALSVAVDGRLETERRFPFQAQAAKNSAVSVGDLQRLFAHSGGSDWKTGEVKASVDGNFFVPVSVQKQWRRQLEEAWVSAPICFPSRRQAALDAACAYAAVRVADNTLTVFGSRRAANGKAALRCDPLHQIGAETDEALLPFFLPEPKTADLQSLIDAAASAGVGRFRLTSLFQLAYRYPKNAVLTAAHPLPAANAFAAQLLLEQGIDRVQLWAELGEAEAAVAFAAFGCACERFVFGKFPVLATRAALAEGEYSSDEEEATVRRWQVCRDEISDTFLLYPQADLTAVPFADCGCFYGESDFSQNDPISFVALR